MTGEYQYLDELLNDDKQTVGRVLKENQGMTIKQCMAQ